MHSIFSVISVLSLTLPDFYAPSCEVFVEVLLQISLTMPSEPGNLSGWVYYHNSNVMQYSNMALETTALVMYDPYAFFSLRCHFFLWLCESHKLT